MVPIPWYTSWYTLSCTTKNFTDQTGDCVYTKSWTLIYNMCPFTRDQFGYNLSITVSFVYAKTYLWFIDDGTLFAFAFHKMQQDKTSHDKTQSTQQQYVVQTKFGISEMYCKINGNIQIQFCLRVLCLSGCHDYKHMVHLWLFT